jgi:hypothetical protein
MMSVCEICKASYDDSYYFEHLEWHKELIALIKGEN